MVNDYNLCNIVAGDLGLQERMNEVAVNTTKLEWRASNLSILIDDLLAEEQKFQPRYETEVE
jgi:hypothetical protein